MLEIPQEPAGGNGKWHSGAGSSPRKKTRMSSNKEPLNIQDAKLVGHGDPVSPAVTDQDTRRYKRLSEEEKHAVLSEWRSWLEEGFSQPKLEDSLIGLDWSLFRARTFPEHENDILFRTPPEFMMYAFSALDAYVTALLGTDSANPGHGIFDYTCSLKQGAAADLHMELNCSPEQRNTGSRRLMLELLNSFPRLLEARGIETETVAYLIGPGHPMQFAYPGAMVASRSPYLCHRPAELWPAVTLSLAANDELVTRARKITAFLMNAEAEDGVPN
jgi:hypothetical protein